MPAEAGAVRSYAGRLAHARRPIGSGADYRLGMSGTDHSTDTRPDPPPDPSPHVSPVQRRVFLDAASGQPTHPTARDALRIALDEGWADPRGMHHQSRRSALLLDAARESVAAALGARPDEISFTASGTAAVHLGIAGFTSGRARDRSTLVAGAVEHSSVLAAGRRHERIGGATTVVGVDEFGRIDLGELARAVGQDGVAAVCVQSANHEVGTTQPIDEVADICARVGVPLVVDAAASIGALDPPGAWSVLTASAHKWGGPPGVGIRAIRNGTRWRASTPEAEREGGRVPGFPNVPAIAAAAVSLEAVERDRASTSARLSSLVSEVRRRVPELVADVQVLGDPVGRVPHIVTFSCLYVDGEALLLELDRRGVAVSSGSACTASAQTPSHVLAAMGVLTHGNVRVSLPHDCTAEDIEHFLQVLPLAVADVRSHLGANAW